ncbi:MAG: Transcriptional regulator, LysR family [Desulfonauticus sp. 38_4375]|nr:MAG: Transcriptional regulator, LysR family [Desulfonauticus sp. 38_4375]
MDLRKLEAFYYVFKTGSFSRAAEEIFLSQPTVSTHISSLEKELGVKLFDRNGRNALPTPAGRLLFSRVRELFDLLKKTKQEISELKEQVEGEVIIGASTIPATYLLPPVLANFLKEYPRVSVSLEVSDSWEIWNKTINGEVDFGLTGGIFEDDFLQVEKVLEDDLIVIASPELNLDFTKVFNFSQLKTLPWVMREKGSGTRKAMERTLNQANLSFSELTVVLEVKTTEALVQYVLNGIGLGFTSRMVVKDYLDKGLLKEVKIKDLHFSRSFYLVWNPRREAFPLFCKLREFIKNNIGKARV